MATAPPGAATPAPGGEGGKPYVVDVTSATFEAEVVRSKVPVILDCWAPWCGPCRQLTPMLEAVVANAKGALKLAKLNVDDAKDVAGALQVSSIPAVFGVVNGRVVDSFVGVVDGARMQKFVETLASAAEAPAGGAAPSQAEALGMMMEIAMRSVTGRTAKEGWPTTTWAAGLADAAPDSELKGKGTADLPEGSPTTAGHAAALLGEVGRVAQAIAAQAKAVAESPTEELSKELSVDSASAVFALARLALATEGGEAALAVLDSHARLLEIAETHDPAVAEAQERLRDAATTAGRAAEVSAGMAGLREAAERDPADAGAAAALADALVVADEPQEAVDVLLGAVKSAKAGGSEDALTAAREAIFAAFDRIGAGHPVVVAGRRQLARLLL